MIGGGDESGAAALAYIQFYRTGFHSQTFADKIFEIFAAARQHFVAESVGTHRGIVFADKSSVRVMDTFGNADNHAAVFFQGFFDVFQEVFRIEIAFRKIYVTGIVAFVFTGKDSGGSEPACVASHDLHDGDGFLLIHRSVKNDFPYSGSHIFGGASIAGSVICVYKVVVDGLGLADHADRAVDLRGIAGKLAHRIHGIVAAYVKEPADIQFLKLFKKKRINGIFQRLRQFVTAGTQIRAGSMFQVFQLISWKSLPEIQDTVFQKTFDSVYHTVNLADFIRMSQPFGNNSVKAAVDHCGRTAGLSDDKIHLCHGAPPLGIIVTYILTWRKRG